ncbi:MAG: capsule biosynthesis protein [Caulobacteraceae bacterium]|nr:capsule biosynthesis protein [Caulobacteraceae bacterium]
METPWLRHPTRRRFAFGIAAAVLAVLCVWPRHYVARAALFPQESASGLSGFLSQQGSGGGLAGLGALLGQRPAIETDLAVGRSNAVARDVAARLRLVGRPGFENLDRAEVRLRRKVDIAALRGSILQITAKDADPAFAKSLADAFAAAIQSRLAALTLGQSTQKRAVADNRMNEATLRLAKAQAALGRFREANKLAAPPAQLGVAVTQLGALQARLQAKRVELDILRQFATDQNLQVRAARAEIAGLEGEIAHAQAATGPNATNLAGMAQKSSEYFNLFRDEQFAQILYQIYSRYLETVTIEALSAPNNMEIIDPAYVDPARQYNAWAVGLLLMVLASALAAEAYLARP